MLEALGGMRERFGAFEPALDAESDAILARLGVVAVPKVPLP